MRPNTLFLRLEGPLQAWGERSRWSIRDTAPEPTKSGLIGLIACAFGYTSDEQIRPLSQKTRLGIRVDAPGTQIVDYHTIGGGYDYPTLLTARGKPKKSSGRPHTEISERSYLCGASFLAALQIRHESDAPLIEQMAHALQNPVWPVYLGRKACVPSRPVFAGTATCHSLTEALTNHTGFTQYRPHGPNKQPFALKFILESDQPTGRRRRDNLHSRQYRVYHPRYTTTPAPDDLPTFTVKEENGDVSLQITA